jgi:DNA-binding NarL/FixJ family response regulator
MEQGLSDKQIAEKMGIAVGTCKIHSKQVRHVTGLTRFQIRIQSLKKAV